MSIGEYVGLGSYGIGILAAFVGMSFKISSTMKILNDEDNKKHTRIYSRIDEVKDAMDRTFAKKEICSVIHENLARDVREMRDDIKILLRQNGLSKNN